MKTNIERDAQLTACSWREAIRDAVKRSDTRTVLETVDRILEEFVHLEISNAYFEETFGGVK